LNPSRLRAAPVGRGEERGRLIALRHRKSAPFVLRRIRGRRQGAVPSCPDRRERGHTAPDPSIGAGEHELRGRHLPAIERGLELRRRVRAIERQRRELGGPSGLKTAPLQRERQVAFGIERDHRAVRRIQTLVVVRLTPFDANRFLLDGHVDPAASIGDLMRVRRIEPLDVDVLGVGVERGHRPGDPVVVADGDARQPRGRRADHVPAGRLEVDQVAR